jgi:hypothetical protein
MRTVLIVLACIIACSLTAGCSDDASCPNCPTPEVQEQPLAQFVRAESYEDQTGNFYSVRIKIYYTATNDTLAYLLVDGTDSGTTFTFDASDPGFADFAAMATNGIDDRLSVSAMLDPSGGGSGVMGNESNYYQGGLSGDMTPDLAGAQVTSILLHLDRLTIFRQGGTTLFNADFRVVYMGTR